MRKAWIPAALAVLHAGLACGAESRLEPPDLERYLRWGALRARPGIELANLGYDDNILYTSDNPVSDYTATVFGKLDGLVLFGSRAFLEFREKLGYTAYLENSNQDYPIQLGRAKLTFPVKRMGLFGDLVLNRDTERPVDQEDVRPTREEDGLGLGVILEPGWRTSIQVARRVTRWRYQDPDYTNFAGQTVAERLDRTDSGFTLEGDYRLRGHTLLTLDALVGNIDFVSPDSAGRSKDSTQWRVEPGIEFREGGKLTGEARLGWNTIDAADRRSPDFAGVIGSFKLAYRPVGRTTIGLEGVREPSLTVASVSTYALNARIGANLLYYFNRILGLEGGVGAGRITFPSTEDIIGRVDTIRTYDVGLRFRLAQNSLGRRVEYRLRYRSYQRRSPVESQNVNRSAVGLEAAVGF